MILTNNPDRASYRQRIGVYLNTFRTEGIEPTVVVLEKSLFKRICQYKSIDRYDVVLLHKKCLNWLDGLFFNPQKAKVIFNYDDAIMFNDKGQQTRTHRKRFKRSLKKANKVLVGSSYLAQQALLSHDDVKILPLGLNTADYCPDTLKPNDGKVRLVWIGSTPTLDYIRQLTPVIQKLAVKYPNLVLRLICDEFIDIKSVEIEKIQWTPQARGQGLAESDIGLAPLPDTPFTRGKCSFKVLEYSASGLPVIASSIGTNPDHVKEGQTGFLITSPEKWFEKLDLLINDPSLRRQMGKAGISYAQHFDTAVIGKRICDIIQNCSP
ncbi:MAG: glycosyltransferase family 4 protein [Planctomycetota bacterium]